MTGERALTFVEIDVDYCANNFGFRPCTANKAGVTVVAAQVFDFSSGSDNGFTASEATITAQVGGLLFEPTADDPILRRTGLSFAGSTNRYIEIDVERVSARSDGAVWQGTAFYSTAGHPESASFYKLFPEIGLMAVGDRKAFVLDMGALSVGGNDWITNTITGIRFDFDDAQGTAGVCGDFRIISIGIGALATAGDATGDDKCFNSLKTCQDRVNFNNDPVTIRFAEDTIYLPKDIAAIPSVTSVQFQPTTISLGQDLGQRATITITFRDHKHNDTGPGFDKYYAERDYDPFEQGTFWGKFRARQPYLKGRPMRLIRGFLGETLAQMDTRHYIIESFNGPTPQGTYTLVAKDVLKLADGDRAQAPALSNGFLVAGINSAVTSATLSPSGIGNSEYPASGYVAIGGEEICAFTRSGDVLTLTRGQLGTTAAAHDAQDRVQLCLRYDGEDPSDIIYDLFTTYAAIPAEYITLSSWLNETESFLQRLYGATIAEPTDVSKLVSELVEQAALAIWWDDLNRKINLQVLRAISTDAAVFDDDNILEGTLQVTEQPNARASQIWTYYGQRNPLRPIDEPDNFRSTLATVNLQAESDEGQAAIVKIYSRWIPAFGRDTAERLNDIQLGRFQVPPRRFQWEVFRGSVTDPVLGGGYQIGAYSIQDESGAPALAPVQITRLNPLADRFTLEAEEMLFEALDPADLTNRTIIIDSDTLDFNLRTVHDGIYPAPTVGESPSIILTCIVQSGVLVGSSSAATPAFDVGSWPAGVSILVQVLGNVRGAGGDGGGDSDPDGEVGGTALYTRYAISLQDETGTLWGGGGGGGRGRGTTSFPATDKRAGGGGGAGQVPGDGGVCTGGTSNANGSPGTLTTGGAGGSATVTGGTGGTPGASGSAGNGNAASGGSAGGNAIDGLSFVTQVGPVGSRLGGQVN
jgi:hypothetical protein